MALLGDSIDPRLFLQDFGGFARAGQTTANGISSAIGTLTSGMNERSKEQKEAKNVLKASQAQIDAAINLFPDQSKYLSEIGAALKDEDTPLTERAAIGAQTADFIAMAVGQKRYETEQDWRQKDLDLRVRDQNLQEKQSEINRQITELSLQGARNDLKASELDMTAKETIGPALLDIVLGMAPSGIRKDVSDKLAAGEYSDQEKFTLANSIQALIPKSERTKAPAIQDVPVPGGTQKMQWDEIAEKWVPIQTDAVEIILPGGVIDTQDGAVLPPKPGADGYGLPTENIPGLPPINGYPAGPPVGFAPSGSESTPEQRQAAMIAKTEFDQRQADKKQEDAKSIAASARTLETIGKYVTDKGMPTETLQDAVGFGEGVGTFFGRAGVAGNSAKTISNQQELNRQIEASLLEASKALKPVSNDEMILLKNNRPKITDPPEVWADFLNNVRSILSDPSNYKPGQAPPSLPKTPEQSATSKIKGLYGK